LQKHNHIAAGRGAACTSPRNPETERGAGGENPVDVHEFQDVE
jgi:hypothetical protein